MKITKIKITDMLVVLIKHLQKGRTHIDVEITKESLEDNILFISGVIPKQKERKSKDDGTFDLGNINEIV